MKIEAICARNGMHPEYLVRVSHAEAMALGGKTFEAGEPLFFTSALKYLEITEHACRSLRNGIEQTLDKKLADAGWTR